MDEPDIGQSLDELWSLRESQAREAYSRLLKHLAKPELPKPSDGQNGDKMSLKIYNVPPMQSPDPEPEIKLADIARRNDKRLEELLDEYIKGLDKIEEVK